MVCDVQRNFQPHVNTMNAVSGRCYNNVMLASSSRPQFNPFTADPVKALHFAILI